MKRTYQPNKHRRSKKLGFMARMKTSIIKRRRRKGRIKNNRSFKYKDYIIYKERKSNDVYKFGISVSKKIGNAVVRNKLKRQIKNIIDKKCYENSFNCIIILRKGILEKSFSEMSEDLYCAFKILKLIKEGKSEK